MNLGNVGLKIMLTELTGITDLLRRLKSTCSLEQLLTILLCLKVRQTTPKAVDRVKELRSADTRLRWAKSFKPLSLVWLDRCHRVH
jgi:hypothetical protein